MHVVNIASVKNPWKLMIDQDRSSNEQKQMMARCQLKRTRKMVMLVKEIIEAKNTKWYYRRRIMYNRLGACLHMCALKKHHSFLIHVTSILFY